MKKKPIQIGKYHFESMKELNLTIKLLIEEAPRNIEFENDVLITIINELHKSVKKYNLKCIKLKILDYNNQIGVWGFVRERFRGGIYVLGFFEPINKWHGVTLYPHKHPNEKQKIINALRQKLNENLKPRNSDVRCEVCGEGNPQLHHNNITFKKIIEECLGFFSEEELKYGIGDDWWKHENEADALDNNHPAILKMLELHKNVKYKWLCWEHHKETF